MPKKGESKYPIQLSEWLEDVIQLGEITKTLRRHRAKYIIKEDIKEYWSKQENKSVRGVRYAVFIQERREQERRKRRSLILDMPFDRYILMFIGQKRDGIGIFKTLRMVRTKYK